MENRVDIKVETDIVTDQTAAHFVTSILEFLLYQRNQIPFVCKTFKYLVSKWDKDDANDEAPANFQVERQKDLARQTMDNIKLMGEVISKGFEQSSVSRVRFLFGSTAVLPKEVYTINIPPISRDHSYEHHKLNAAMLNQALISLLTSDCLYDTFSTNLPPTNVFLELEMPDNDAMGWENIFSTDLCDLPSSCKQVFINLVHTLPKDYVETKCCKDLIIFKDLSSLSLADDSNTHVENKTIDTTGEVIGWWEASTILRGFKQTAAKGINLWQ